MAAPVFAGDVPETLDGVFEGLPGALRLALINSGCHVAPFFAMFGLVLNLWH